MRGRHGALPVGQVLPCGSRRQEQNTQETDTDAITFRYADEELDTLENWATAKDLFPAITVNKMTSAVIGAAEKDRHTVFVQTVGSPHRWVAMPHELHELHEGQSIL